MLSLHTVCGEGGGGGGGNSHTHRSPVSQQPSVITGQPRCTLCPGNIRRGLAAPPGGVMMTAVFAHSYRNWSEIGLVCRVKQQQVFFNRYQLLIFECPCGAAIHGYHSLSSYHVLYDIMGWKKQNVMVLVLDVH